MKKAITVTDDELLGGIANFLGLPLEAIKDYTLLEYGAGHPNHGQIKMMFITTKNLDTVDIRRDELINGILQVSGITDAEGGYKLYRTAVTAALDKEDDFTITLEYKTG